MLLVKKTSGAVLIVLLAFAFASGQTAVQRRPDAIALSREQTEVDKPSTQGTTEASQAPAVSSEPTVWVHLAGGRRMQVDDVTQMPDGIWYTRGNVSTFLDAARVIRIERSETRRQDSPAAVEAGSGRWKISDSGRVENFFLSRFKRPLPTTAMGQSQLHTRWGLDHRNGMDVGLHPDSVEGKALIKFLTSEEIPFLAFRTSIAGVATGPHIHVGNSSHRIGNSR
ncbi:MAG TPA: hypothetical protein VMZ30_11450 [Pyrinomonadaceae bacterium]|nr:hypothetical protein [Pyrinomonadaceae bacterium]